MISDYVKAQRKRFKENPSLFFKEEFVLPTWHYWKNRPFHALFTFFYGFTLYYVLFGLAQAVIYDATYCDSTQDIYNGKVIPNLEHFIEDYNIEMLRINTQYLPIYSTEKERELFNLNRDMRINCSQNMSRWIKEPFEDRVTTIKYTFLKIISKGYINGEK